MADLSVTAANVIASNSAVIDRGYSFGATITAGQAVYLDTTQSPPRWELLDIDANTVGTNTIATLRGISLNGGSDGQPADVCIKDPDFTPGATLTNGLAVYGSTTAGGITTADIPTTNAYPVILGLTKSTSKMNLNPTASGAIIS